MPERPPQEIGVTSYQELGNIRLQETNEGQEPKVTIRIDESASPQEVEDKVRKELARTNWWLQEQWQKKGAPKEQISISYNSGTIEIYNFGEQLSDQYLAELEEVANQYAKIEGGEYLSRVKYLLLDNERSLNVNTGEDQFGERLSPIDSVVIFPDGLSFAPHRVPETSRFSGTLIHEIAHVFASEMQDEWIREFGWEELETPADLPGGAKQYFKPPADDAFITDYGKTHPQEDICDSVVAYFVSPQSLSTRKREILERKLGQLEELTGEDTEIQKKAEIELPKLDEPVLFARKKPLKSKVLNEGK